MEHHSKKETGNKLESTDHAGPCKTVVIQPQV